MSGGDDDAPEAAAAAAAETAAATPPPLPPLPLEFIPVGHPDSSMSVESVRRAVEEFAVRADDIVCATFPKTGTTLVTW